MIEQRGIAAQPRGLDPPQRTPSGRGLKRARTAVAWGTAGLMVLLVAVALCSAPASALSQRGHVFGFAFGGGEGQLAGPEAVAVNESSEAGNVYVADTGNERLERFACSTSSCTFVSQLKLKFAPREIAVDNSASSSSSDVYVASEEAVYKYSASGALLATFTGFKAPGLEEQEFGEIRGIALDALGDLYVYVEEGIVKFDSGSVEKARNKFVGKVPVEGCEARAGLGVSPNAEAFYVGRLREFGQGACQEEPEPPPVVIAKLDGEGELQQSALDGENSTGVAVDMASGLSSPLGEAGKGNVYVDNANSIAAFDSSGALVQRFGSEAGTDPLTRGRGLAIDSRTGAVYVADARKNKIEVFLPKPPGAPVIDDVSSQNVQPTSTELRAQIDPNGADTHYYFQYGTADCASSPAACSDVPTAPPGSDIGSGFGDQTLSATVAELQPDTAYYYRVLASNDCGQPGQSCTVESSPKLNTFTTLPSGAGVLVDDRAWELVSPADKGGAGIEAIGGPVENGAPGGGPMQASADGAAVTYVANAPVVSEPAGARSPEGTQVISTRTAGGWASQDIATPQEHGEGLPAGTPQEYRLFSSDLSLGLVQPWGLTAMQEPPLVPGVPAEERGIFVRHDASCQASPSSCYQPLVTTENDTAKEPFGGHVGFLTGGNGMLDATPDLSHVVFESEVALSAKEPLVPGLYEWSADKPPAEQLALVNVSPKGKPNPEEAPRLGDAITVGVQARNAISNDGSRVTWTNGIGDRLYQRDTATATTLQLNAAASGLKEPHEEEAELDETRFQIASTDGTRIFFTDTAPLTHESLQFTQEAGPADLYVCETHGGESSGCELKDLTVDHNAGASGDMVGVVLGASEDGSSVYFVANGALAPGARPGSCGRANQPAAPPSATCNLYVEQFDNTSREWEAPRFIAALSQQDANDWSEELGRLTARVSPNGRYLAFMSDQPLTGYDNVDQSPEAHGARDEEVFLYDASSGRLVCASCKPSGERPQGVLDQQGAGEGLGLLVDRPKAWNDRWLAASIPGYTQLTPFIALYQSRYLSNSGRLFFNSPDELVALPAGEQYVHKENVYEYEPDGAGSCARSAGCVGLISSGTSTQESAFLDASESGDDVFFVSAQPLVAADRDKSADLYDAHVCSAESPCLSAPPPPPAVCSDEQSCRPAAQITPATVAPASASFSGPGNATPGTPAKPPPKPVLSRALKFKKALQTCKRRYGRSRKRRVRCERQAQKLYSAKTSVKRTARSTHTRRAKR